MLRIAMSVFTISGIKKLGSTRNTIDAEIVDFVRKRNMRTLTYKDYKYLRCAASMYQIHNLISSQRIGNMDAGFELALIGARTDSAIERTGNAAMLLVLRPNVFSELAPLLEDERKAGTFRQYIDIRERTGVSLGRIASSILHSQQAHFWEKLSIVAMHFDTLVDFFADKRAGLVKNARASDFPYLFRRLATNATDVILELGLMRTIRYLVPQAFSTFKSSFMKDDTREKELPIF